jgi:hypothetical protein
LRSEGGGWRTSRLRRDRQPLEVQVDCYGSNLSNGLTGGKYPVLSFLAASVFCCVLKKIKCVHRDFKRPSDGRYLLHVLRNPEKTGA